MSRFIGLFIFNCLIAATAFAQTTLSPKQLLTFQRTEDTLEIYANTVFRDSIKENRIDASKKMEATLLHVLAQRGSFDYAFDSLKSISIKQPEDKRFRIFTWQLYVDENTYQYGGIIQVNTKGKPKIFRLEDHTSEIVDAPEEETLSAERWHGALYYNIKSTVFEGKPHYILFGFNGLKFFEKRKLMEVLWFDKQGNPVFGAPLFVRKDAGEAAVTKSRIILDYSAESTIRLNFDTEENMIIFDNLIAMKGQLPNQGTVMVTDGSYRGYTFNGKAWNYIDKLATLDSAEAPREKPILLDGRKGKNLFGEDTGGEVKPKKKKKQ
jgi:hypothetical protein